MAWNPDRRRRVAVNLFIGFHALMIVGSLANGTAVGTVIRKVTGPYERFIGIYQNWDMFSPNAPRESTWTEISGLTASGAIIALPGMVEPPATTGVRIRYQRLGKLDRNLAKKERRAIRRGMTAWECANYTGEDALRYVIFTEVKRKTPAPADWQDGATRAEARREVERVRCP